MKGLASLQVSLKVSLKAKLCLGLEGFEVSICPVDSNPIFASEHLSCGLESKACERSNHITTDSIIFVYET